MSIINTISMPVILVAMCAMVLSGLGLLMTENREEKYPVIHKISKGVFYGIGLIALVLALTMGE